MLEEDTVAAANRGLAVARRIPGESDPWGGIEQMPLQATDRGSAHSALHQPHLDDHLRRKLMIRGEQNRRRGRGVQQNSRRRVNGKRGPVKLGGHEIPSDVVFFPVRSKKTDAQPQIERQPMRDFPIVLEVGLCNLVGLVIATLSAVLREALYVSGGSKSTSLGG